MKRERDERDKGDKGDGSALVAVPLATDDVVFDSNKVTREQAQLKNGTQCVRFKLPHGALWFCGWPSELVEPPTPTSDGHYRPMQLYGKHVVMPRKTWCYGFSYGFSGQVHPVEKRTPPEVQALYDWANAALGYEGKAGFNMNLRNDYPTGCHNIGRHSDDEKQFGLVRDVICFVTGSAKRKLIIRDKETKEIVMSLALPAGVYCMEGLEFQKFYTHEIPELHPSLFKKVLAKAVEWFGEDWPSQLSRAEQAEWIAAEPARTQLVRKNLAAKDQKKWDEWLKPRTSHTLRNFTK